VLTLPLLVAVGDCAGLLGGFLVASVTLQHLGAEQFMTRAIHALILGDLVWLTKPVVFGFIIATVGCLSGFRVEGGTAGSSGRATIKASRGCHHW
jgi:phospholipid/cholesterol/gamma-HCH transport system permease protein